MRLPTVIDIEGPVLVFGGGKVALRKVEYLSRFTHDITVVAKETLPMPGHVTVKELELRQEDLESVVPKKAALVVAALSDVELNRAIAAICRERGIFVNVVDDPEPSTIQFPALSKAGELNVAVSTTGKCPFLARKIREECDTWIGEKGLWLEVLAPLRERLVGMDEKNRVLAIIYEDEELQRLVRAGDKERAEKRAKEVFDVHSEH